MHVIDANGANIPAVGYGTWTLEGQACSDLVAHAIRSGYRHVDTADMYNNEEAVGAGLKASGVPRNDVFLTTKVWFTNLADGDLQRSAETSVNRLGVDHVDLLLIHWPSKTIPLAESIAALNDARDRGLARNIGVSNFPVAMLDEAVSLSAHPLACNQVEYHPRLNQDKVLEACRRHGVALVSYCPLCRDAELLANDPVAALARKYGRTPAQIVLRWHVQQEGVACIPRSKTPSRIEENLAIFDFELEDEDMAAISALSSQSLRICDFEFSPKWD